MTDIQLDHKALLATLSDEERLQLTESSDWRGLFHFASRLTGLVVTGFWIAFGYSGWQLALVLHGIQLIFLFTLLHETVHDTPFKSQWLNRAAGWLVGLFIVLPPEWFRYFHLAHHRHTHDPEKDPELEGLPEPTLARYLWTIMGFPVWKFHFVTLIRNALGKGRYPYLPKSAEVRIAGEARLMIAVYLVIAAASVLFQSMLLFWLWIVPAALGQPFLRLYLMAEHGRCPHVANMFANTRTTFTNSIIRWLAWNMPYHAEHHALPTVPFHKLPEFHALVKSHLKVTENGYHAFHARELMLLKQSNRQIPI